MVKFIKNPGEYTGVGPTWYTGYCFAALLTNKEAEITSFDLIILDKWNSMIIKGVIIKRELIFGIFIYSG